MSNITPIRSPAPQWGGGGWGGAPNDGWEWNGSQWVWCGQPWPQPPCPPPCPPPAPQVQCGPPSCMSAVAKAQACYDQSQSLYNLVSQVVSDIFAKNPGIIPSPPPSAGSGPILGVTDGSDAAPGEVGEFVTITANYAYAADALSLGSVSTLVLQPGDWHMWAFLTTSSVVDAAFFYLSPLPTGASNNMTGNIGVGGTPAIEYSTVVSAAARGSFSVPTLLAFNIGVQTGTGAPAGTAALVVSARRLR